MTVLVMTMEDGVICLASVANVRGQAQADVKIPAAVLGAAKESVEVES